MYVADWKIAASQIENEMVGHMDSLISDAEQKLSNEKTRLASEQESHLVELTSDGEHPSEHDDESQSEDDLTETIDSSTAKYKEKQRRKIRNLKRKRKK